MMRSRDDNLILLCSNLLLYVFSKCSDEAIGTMEIMNKGPTAYTLVKAVSSLLVLDPPFRPATIKCLYLLILKTLKVSGIQAKDLPADDLSRLNVAFIRIVSNLKKMMDYPKLLKYLLELFEKEVSDFDGIEFYTIEASHMYYMLCPPPEPGQKGVPFDLSTITTERDMVKREILLYLGFVGIFQNLYPGAPKLDIGERLRVLGAEGSSLSYKQGDNFDIASKRYYLCYIKTLTSKRPVFIVEDPKLFVLVERKSETYGEIKFVEHLKYVDLMIDNSNPRALVVTSKNRVISLNYSLMIWSFTLITSVKWYR